MASESTGRRSRCHPATRSNESPAPVFLLASSIGVPVKLTNEASGTASRMRFMLGERMLAATPGSNSVDELLKCTRRRDDLGLVDADVAPGRSGRSADALAPVLDGIVLGRRALPDSALGLNDPANLLGLRLLHDHPVGMIEADRAARLQIVDPEW